MASLELITNLKLIDGSARTTVPTPEELPLGYMCFGIVNSRASIWGNYDGSVHDLVEEGTHQVEIVQETGQSTTVVMSQKAVTDELNDKLDKGPIPSEYLPQYVDDVLEYDSKSAFPATGETGKIYIDKSTNLIYRWSGSTYIMVGGGDLNLENGTGTGSLVQKRLKSDGITWTTAKAYQGAGTAFGGNTQAGRTEGEFNSYFWDNANNVPLNGGRGKDSNGNILDNNGLTYAKSYSYALAEGESTKALGRSSHAEGNNTQAIGIHSHSEGLMTNANGYIAHAEGQYTQANGAVSHAEGDSTKSEGIGSHAEGNNTTSSGKYSHSEGYNTTSSNEYAHSEGHSTVASGLASHAEGLSTKAEGYATHTEGAYTEAYYTGSHAEGNHTKTYAEYQHVSGTYNYYKKNALYIVGNGTSDNDRKNAFEVLKDGRAKVQSAPVDDDDVVRKKELSKLYKHSIWIRFPSGSDVMYISVTCLLSHNTKINTPALLEKNSVLLSNIANVEYGGTQNGGGVFSSVYHVGEQSTYKLTYTFGGSSGSLSLASFISMTDTVTEL